MEDRQTKWSYENSIDKEEAAYRIHDVAGRALEVGLTYDQLDITNYAMAEVIGRMYSLVEETSGSMQMEGVEYLVGRDEGSARTAVAPGLRKHQSDKLERDVSVAKNQRRPERSFKGCSEKEGIPRVLKGRTRHDLWARSGRGTRAITPQLHGSGSGGGCWERRIAPWKSGLGIQGRSSV